MKGDLKPSPGRGILLRLMAFGISLLSFALALVCVLGAFVGLSVAMRGSESSRAPKVVKPAPPKEGKPGRRIAEGDTSGGEEPSPPETPPSPPESNPFGRIAGTVSRLGDSNIRIWKYIENGDYPSFQSCLKDLNPLIINGCDHYTYLFDYNRSERSAGKWPQYTESGTADINLLAAVIVSSPERNPYRNEMLRDLLQTAAERHVKDEMVNQRMGEEGRTPLMFAAQLNDADVIDVLLENGADKALKTINETQAHQLASQTHLRERLEP